MDPLSLVIPFFVTARSVSHSVQMHDRYYEEYHRHNWNKQQAIVAAFDSQIEFALTTHVDHKTELQEQLARSGRSVLYTVLEITGPPHDRTFTAAAVIDGEVVGTGVGRSKKDAEQAAAREALQASASDSTDA